MDVWGWLRDQYTLYNDVNICLCISIHNLFCITAKLGLMQPAIISHTIS